MAFDLGFRGNAQQLDECWDALDENGDGLIQFYELKEFFLDDLVTSIAAALLRNQLHARILTYRDDVLLLKRLFAKGDKDGSGLIDFDEFEVLTDTLGFSGTQGDISDTFAAIDADGSGDIDFEELKAFFIQKENNFGDSANILKGLLASQITTDRVDGDTLRRIFAKHDSDNSGYIDKFEFDVCECHFCVIYMWLHQGHGATLNGTELT